MSAAAAPVLIDRTEVHKSCKSLEVVVAVLCDYTEASNALAIVRKKLAKALKECASLKATNHVPASAMMNSAGVFEALTEVDAKLAKVADKEAEYVGSELKKWFKKLAKDERAHDERIANANARIKQAGQSYEKKAKRRDRDAMDEHSRYLAILNAVGPEMSQDKYNHHLAVTLRHTSTLCGCAASISRLAEAEWTRACESVRKSAPCIGNVGQWRAFCEGGWSRPSPDDLPDLGTPKPEREKRIDDYMNKTHDTTRILLPPPPTSIYGYPDSPTSLSATKNLPSTGRSSETNSVPDHLQILPSRSSSPPNSTPDISRKKSERPTSANALPTVPQQKVSNDTVDSSEAFAASSPMTPLLSAQSGDMKSPRLVHEQKTLQPPAQEQETTPPLVQGQETLSLSGNERGISPDIEKTADQDGTPKLESKVPHPLSLQEVSPLLAESLPVDRAQTESNNSADERQSDQKAPVSSPINLKSTHTSGTATLDRRKSVESLTSNASLVAAMRGRYDGRSVEPASPSPRDMPRLSQSVTNLATRYMPIDSPTSQRGLAAERFPTFRDRYPHTFGVRDRGNDKDRHRGALDTPVSERDYFTERDIDRYHTSPLAVLTDRNTFREDHDRNWPRSSDGLYVDELGMHEQLRRVGPVAEERALKEREDRLRERERELDMERARLASAREGGYASDASGRSRGYGTTQRMESPEPMQRHVLRPPDGPLDHSPSCGCERCSARHYASTSPLPRTKERVESPIKLRPEKPKNWIRRLSMPVVGPSKGGGGGIVSIPLPEEDGRVTRRSFEMEREQSARFGGTTRR